MNLGLEMKRLVDKGLVSVKKHPTKDLYLYKYKKKVFFDKLWHTDRNLKHARGLVLDGNGEVVVYPMVKIFNLGEKGYDPLHSFDWAEYSIHKKFNGFMLAVTWYDDEWLLTTTGSFDSKYVDMGKEMLGKSDILPKLSKNPKLTYLFEICHPDDPHIVHEEYGAYLLLTSDVETLKSRPRVIQDSNCKLISDADVRIPLSSPDQLSEKELMEKFVTYMGLQDTEGVVVWRHSRDGSSKPLFKYKTRHYLTKKFLMRLGTGKADMIFGGNWRQNVDEEFYDVVEYIRDNFGKESWLKLEEQDRRTIVEHYFNK